MSTTIIGALKLEGKCPMERNEKIICSRFSFSLSPSGKKKNKIDTQKCYAGRKPVEQASKKISPFDLENFSFPAALILHMSSESIRNVETFSYHASLQHYQLPIPFCRPEKLISKFKGFKLKRKSIQTS